MRFETLFGKHYDDVLAYALRRSDGDTAQDVVADTFLVAWRRLGVVPAGPLPGRMRLRGQDVIGLEARDGDGAPIAYFVDAETHVPVEIRLTLNLPQPDFASRRARVRILEYERLPLTAENQRLLRLFPHPGARVEQARG